MTYKFKHTCQKILESGFSEKCKLPLSSITSIVSSLFETIPTGQLSSRKKFTVQKIKISHKILKN